MAIPMFKTPNGRSKSPIFFMAFFSGRTCVESYIYSYSSLYNSKCKSIIKKKSYQRNALKGENRCPEEQWQIPQFTNQRPFRRTRNVLQGIVEHHTDTGGHAHIGHRRAHCQVLELRQETRNEDRHQAGQHMQMNVQRIAVEIEDL